VELLVVIAIIGILIGLLLPRTTATATMPAPRRRSTRMPSTLPCSSRRGMFEAG